MNNDDQITLFSSALGHHGGRHHNCTAHVITPAAPSRASTAKKISSAAAEVDETGKGGGKNWRPPKKSGKMPSMLGTPKKKSWAVQFIEFRAFGECVLDFLRSQVKYIFICVFLKEIKVLYSNKLYCFFR